MEVETVIDGYLGRSRQGGLGYQMVTESPSLRLLCLHTEVTASFTITLGVVGKMFYYHLDLSHLMSSPNKQLPGCSLKIVMI